MEIEKLKDMLRNAAGGPMGIQMCQEAADALEQLQAENDRLQAELEKAEAVRKKQADILYELRGQKYEQTTAIDQLRAENDRLKKEVQQMRWIPVEERLPDKPGHYLVCTNVNYWHGGCMDKNGASSNAGTTDGYAGTTLSVLDCFYDITGDWNRVCNAHVTHWMPLPKVPKEEKKDD